MVDEVEREEERAGEVRGRRSMTLMSGVRPSGHENGKIKKGRRRESQEMQYGHEMQCQDWTPIGAEPTGDRRAK